MEHDEKPLFIRRRQARKSRSNWKLQQRMLERERMGSEPAKLENRYHAYIEETYWCWI